MSPVVHCLVVDLLLKGCLEVNSSKEHDKLKLVSCLSKGVKWTNWAGRDSFYALRWKRSKVRTWRGITDLVGSQSVDRWIIGPIGRFVSLFWMGIGVVWNDLSWKKRISDKGGDIPIFIRLGVVGILSRIHLHNLDDHFYRSTSNHFHSQSRGFRWSCWFVSFHVLRLCSLPLDVGDIYSFILFIQIFNTLKQVIHTFLFLVLGYQPSRQLGWYRYRYRYR